MRFHIPARCCSLGCREVIKDTFGDNLTQALDEFNQFYKQDGARCDAVIFKFSQYKDSLLTDPDCDHERMVRTTSVAALLVWWIHSPPLFLLTQSTVVKCKENLIRFGLHWKTPQPPVDRSSWSPAVNRNPFDQSPGRAAVDPALFAPSARSPESSGHTFPRLNSSSRRRLNFTEEEQNGAASPSRTEQSGHHPQQRSVPPQSPSVDPMSPARKLPPPLPSKTPPLRIAPLKPSSVPPKAQAAKMIDDMV